MQVTVEQVESAPRSSLDAELEAVPDLFLCIFVGGLQERNRSISSRCEYYSLNNRFSEYKDDHLGVKLAVLGF